MCLEVCWGLGIRFLDAQQLLRTPITIVQNRVPTALGCYKKRDHGCLLCFCFKYTRVSITITYECKDLYLISFKARLGMVFVVFSARLVVRRPTHSCGTANRRRARPRVHIAGTSMVGPSRPTHATWENLGLCIMFYKFYFLYHT